MNSEDAFLHTILDHPSDPYPMLVYADWLEERGDPRHEVLRIRNSLVGPSASERKRLEQRGQELLQHVGDPLNGVARINRQLLRCDVTGRGWFRRTLQLSGALNHTIHFDGLGLAASVRVNGTLAGTSSGPPTDGRSYVQFFLPHESGAVRASIMADFRRWRGLRGLSLALRGIPLYREGTFLKLLAPPG
jgi:uncharacterized protein (TIGR02996 family)